MFFAPNGRNLAILRPGNRPGRSRDVFAPGSPTIAGIWCSKVWTLGGSWRPGVSIIGFDHRFRSSVSIIGFDHRFRSSAPITTIQTLVGLGRLERPTSPLSGVRSNHLSYRPESLRPRALDGGALRGTLNRSRRAQARPRRKRSVDGGVPPERQG
jgi:hypothetical protein